MGTFFLRHYINSKPKKQNSEISQKEESTDKNINSNTNNSMEFTLTSKEFRNGEMIPVQYTCDGAGENPPLEIASVPEGTKSFALIVEDPDVPSALREDRMFDHWILYNLPPDTASIPAGEASVGVEGLNTSNTKGWTPPCPPAQFEPSEHRYFFTLYALSTMLDLPEGASKKDLKSAMEGNILEETTLMGRYKRL